MPPTSRRSIWGLLAGAVLTGWCSAAIVSPPAAGTQVLARPATRSSTEITIPRLALALVPPRTPPTSRRNPFAFGSEPSTMEQGRAGAGEQLGAASVASAGRDEGVVESQPRPDPNDGGAWRLIGIGTGSSGPTAVLAGPRGVLLVRRGDRLPTGQFVLDLTEAALTLGRDDGEPSQVLKLP